MYVILDVENFEFCVNIQGEGTERAPINLVGLTKVVQIGFWILEREQPLRGIIVIWVRYRNFNS